MTSMIDGATRAHARAVQDSIPHMATFLRDHLGAALLSVIAGVDVRTVNRWASGEVAPRDPAERRLRATYQVYGLLAEQEAPATIRAWFIGMNPQLDDTSPAEAIANDEYRSAMTAARAFVTGG